MTNEERLAAMAEAIGQHLEDCRVPKPMTYILRIGPWHVGPFPTHAHATWWAESHGVNDYDMAELDDPAEAPAKIAQLIHDLP